MVDSPHAIYPGMDEQDYYRGLVTEAAPGTVPQVAVSKGELHPLASPSGAAEEEGVEA
jgi:NADH-quinone oxidoreductase subunit I